MIGYHENGQKELEQTFKDGKRIGLWTFWYENGKKMYESDCDDSGKGTYKEWYQNGQKKEEGKIRVR